MTIKSPCHEICERCGKVNAIADERGIRVGHRCDKPVPGPPDPPRFFRWSEAFFIDRDGGEHYVVPEGRLSVPPEGVPSRKIRPTDPLPCDDPDKWQWPDWLVAPWIVEDPDGWWWAVDAEPQFISEVEDEFDPDSDHDGWFFNDDPVLLDPRMIDFDPPPCDDWRQSKRRNPRSTKQ